MFCFSFACSPNGASVVQVDVYDDDNDPMLLSLFDDDGGPFSLSPSGLVSYNVSKGTIDFETRTSYLLHLSVVEASNRLGNDSLLFAVQGNLTVAVAVIDVHERPTFSALPTSFSLDEESVYPTIVTPALPDLYIGVTDEDVGNASTLAVNVTATVRGVVLPLFEVVSALDGSPCRGAMNCVLRVRSGAARVNFDAPDRTTVVSIVIRVSDQSGLFSESPATNVSIVDINQGALWR